MKKLLTITALIFSINSIKTNDENIKIIPYFYVNQVGAIFSIINSITKTKAGFTHKEHKANELARQLNVAYMKNGKKPLSQQDIDAITLGWITNNGRKKHTCTIL